MVDVDDIADTFLLLGVVAVESGHDHDDTLAGEQRRSELPIDKVTLDRAYLESASCHFVLGTNTSHEQSLILIFGNKLHQL